MSEQCRLDEFGIAPEPSTETEATVSTQTASEVEALRKKAANMRAPIGSAQPLR